MAQFAKKYDKGIRNRIYLEERRRALEEFRDLEFLHSINPRNKNLLISYMNFLAYTDMTLTSCSNIKNNLKLFLTWNRDYNSNMFFKQIKKSHGEAFFKWAINNNYTTQRLKIIKSDLGHFGEYIEYVLGSEEFQYSGIKNQWYGYKSDFWFKIDIPEPDTIRRPNRTDFENERIGVLRAYLTKKKDFMGVIILEYAHLGIDLLNLKVDDEEFNRQTNYAQNYLRWRDREGIELPDVFVMRNNKTGEYMPMDINKLRKYARMFSVFLGKELIIC